MTNMKNQPRFKVDSAVLRQLATALALPASSVVVDELVADAILVPDAECVNLSVDAIMAVYVRRLIDACRSKAPTPAMSPRPSLDKPIDDLRTAFARLYRGEREALALVVLAGYSYANAAQLLDLDIDTLRASLFSARRRLRQWMNPEVRPRPGYLRVVK